MKWSFIVDITDETDIRKAVEEKAREAVLSIGTPSEFCTFRVLITSYQKRARWLKDNPQIPREDIGVDLDNLTKPVFDGLGPIIGYRTQWQKVDNTGKYERTGESAGAMDSRITEMVAKKVNSGSDSEFLSVEIETIVSYEKETKT